jgi:hypothetical protein
MDGCCHEISMDAIVSCVEHEMGKELNEGFRFKTETRKYLSELGILLSAISFLLTASITINVVSSV